MVYHPIPEDIRKDLEGLNFSQYGPVFEKHGWDHARIKKALEDYRAKTGATFDASRCGDSELERDIISLGFLQGLADDMQVKENFLKLLPGEQGRIRKEKWAKMGGPLTF